MKNIIKIVLLCALSTGGYSQANNSDKYTDSLKMVLNQAKNDTARMHTLSAIASYYVDSDRDISLYYTEQALGLSEKLKLPLSRASFLLRKAYILKGQGNLPLAFKLVNEAMMIAKDKRNEKNAYIYKDEEFANDPHKYRLSVFGRALHQMGNLYSTAGINEKAIDYYKEEIKNSELIKSKWGTVNSNMNIGLIYSGYSDVNKYKSDSALFYLNKALVNSNVSEEKKYQGNILNLIGRIYLKREQWDSVKFYCWKSIRVNKEQNNLISEGWTNISLANLYQITHQTDSMMFYAKSAYQISKKLKGSILISNSSELISKAFQLQGNLDSAYAYLAVSKLLSDSINNDKIEHRAHFQEINFDEQIRLEKVEKDNIAFKNKIRMTSLFAGLGILSLLVLILYRSTRQKQKANILLLNQKEEIQNTLTQLKSTQSQLIQSEKMASLGELTAGIAHEIQNPLNFVNNFSEVSNELIDEMKEEQAAGNWQLATELADDIKQNLEKINHHGKRADAIVKGMLQHSRTSSGQKEPTDINALADEYLRLAYHGLRAKDKSFNATMKTDYDQTIGKIEIIPQDIGRVILNLITNAFYAVSEKKEQIAKDLSGFGTLTGLNSYEPTVSLTTKKVNDKIEIKVADNGNGIPSSIVDKIFQPFFTTKPTGQGTGLGLSLSYDIVKAHGGEIKVETKENEGTEFTIQLPI